MIKRTIHIGSPCKIKTRQKQLVLQYNHVPGQEDKADKSLPIEDIGFLILEHRQISITHPTLNELIENNTAVITCDERMHPKGLMLSLDGNTTQSERYQAQIQASEPLKKQLWQQTIKAKIQNQAALLAHWNIDHNYMNKCAQKVKSGDTDNQEATASYYYWQRLFPPVWEFTRHREGAPPNNLLNYGYAILRATVARSLVGAGLLPTLGIFHRNRYNAYCLADDIMEPFRPCVDSIVRKIIQETSHVEELSKELKAQLLNIPAMDVQYGLSTRPLMIATQLVAADLAKCFLGESRKIEYPSLYVRTA